MCTQYIDQSYIKNMNEFTTKELKNNNYDTVIHKLNKKTQNEVFEFKELSTRDDTLCNSSPITFQIENTKPIRTTEITEITETVAINQHTQNYASDKIISQIGDFKFPESKRIINLTKFGLTRDNRMYCSNCGKYGHIFNCCMDPITSIGIICFKLLSVPVEKHKVCSKEISESNTNCTNSMPEICVREIFNDLLEIDYSGFVKLKYVKGIPLDLMKLNLPKINDSIQDSDDKKIDYNHINNEQLVNIFIKYQDRVRFLLVQRRYSLGYIVLMKGKWNINNKEEMISIFEQMTKNELCNLIDKSTLPDGFDLLWKQFWISKTKKYDREYNILKKKFELLVNHESWNLKFYCNLVHQNNIPEWGFPKGKREHREDNMNCALREFKEETGLTNINLLKKVEPIREDMIGTNGQQYRHLYHIGFVNSDVKIDLQPEKLEAHRSEIGDIGWYSYMEAINLLNEKHVRKKHILTQIYLFIIMRLLKNDSKIN
jgi:8-oxo-dGTP pyrophosphatase MutT (NUDIX family)